MLGQWGFIGIYVILAILIPASMLLIPFALTIVKVKPAKPNPVKMSTYECGLETIGGTWVQFNFRYFYFAIMFVLFDVITVFLFPFAVFARQLDWYGLVALSAFLGTLLVGFAYAWKKKALQWSEERVNSDMTGSQNEVDDADEPSNVEEKTKVAV